MLLLGSLVACDPGEGAGRLVVYTSQDQVYSSTILETFRNETGIDIQVVYDSEAVKTVGLANRLLAERPNPQCDVWWSNEELRTRQLERQDVFRAENPWRAFGYRSRVLVVNTNLLAPGDAPSSLLSLTNETWRGKVAFAYPMFGTTATHFLALRSHWGSARWQAWCRGLADNEPLVVDGNSVVVDMVGRGEAAIGMTDSDDVAAGRRKGWPVMAAAFEETLAIPNTAAVVRGARHPREAQRLMDYLAGDSVADALIEADALQGREPPPGTLLPDWDAVLDELQTGTSEMKSIFLR